MAVLESRKVDLGNKEGGYIEEANVLVYQCAEQIRVLSVCVCVYIYIGIYYTYIYCSSVPIYTHFIYITVKHEHMHQIFPWVAFRFPRYWLYESP